MKNFIFKNSGKIILTLLLLKAGAYFIEEQKKNSEIKQIEPLSINKNIESALQENKKELKVGDVLEDGNIIEEIQEKNGFRFVKYKQPSYDEVEKTHKEALFKSQLNPAIKSKAKANNNKKENGWVREYGRGSGLLIVEKLYKEGKLTVHRDFWFDGKTPNREMFFENEEKGNFTEKHHYPNGAVKSNIQFANFTPVSGQCYTENGTETDLNWDAYIQNGNNQYFLCD